MTVDSGWGGRRASQTGRPKKPKADKIAKRVTLNFTEAEFKAIKSAAQGEAPASFLKAIIMRSLARRKR